MKIYAVSFCQIKSIACLVILLLLHLVTLAFQQKISLLLSEPLFPEWLGTPSKTTPRTTDVISRIRFVDAVSQYFLFLPPQTGTTLLSPIRQSFSSFASPVSFLARSVSLSHTTFISVSRFPPNPPPLPQPPKAGWTASNPGRPAPLTSHAALARALAHTRSHAREFREKLRALASCVSPLCHHPPSLFHLKRRPIICSVLRQTAATTKCKKSYEDSERWNRPSWLT